MNSVTHISGYQKGSIGREGQRTDTALVVLKNGDFLQNLAVPFVQTDLLVLAATMSGSALVLGSRSLHEAQNRTSAPIATIAPLAAMTVGVYLGVSSCTRWLERTASMRSASAMNTVESAATAKDFGCAAVENDA